MEKVYGNKKISVHWDPEKCRHAGHCFRNLPEVFRPGERPWVDIEAADADEIKRVVDGCPSGALTCKLHTDKDS